MNSCLLAFCILCACSAVEAGAAVLTYAGLPYRGRSDSPFAQSIREGTTFVEDFENKRFNTPGIASTNGVIFDSPTSSADEDDGRLDNIGIGWCLTTARERPPEGSPYQAEIVFSPDSTGKFPTHAGALVNGYLSLDNGALRYFQAFDANGLPILMEPLTAAVPYLPNATHLYDSRGDQFFGLIYEEGISRIILGGSTSYDHIQYGYGPIPEPSAGLLAALAAWGLGGRRRRGGGTSFV